MQSAGNTAPTGFATPSAAAFAHDILRRVDAPWRWAAANTVHAMQAALMPLMNEQASEKFAADTMEKLWPDKYGKRKSD